MLRKMTGVTSALLLGAALTASAATLGDIALYNDNVGWIAKAKAVEIGDALKKDVKVGASIKNYDVKALADFAKARTNNGKIDIIVLFGDIAETIYTPGNAQKDDSIVEGFINGGNMVLNTADYIFYVNQGAGSNGDVGLKTITNSNFDLWTDGNKSIPTADGKKYLPSLKEFKAPRSFKKAQVDGDANWKVEMAFGTSADGGNMDPVIIKHTKTGGRVGIVIQVADDAQPRAAVMTELFNNWVITLGSSTAVEPAAKLTTSWASLKSF
ncbi:hypothetical protein FJZ36_04655 [Candidatus Poribacteria bacterium]|nr:hypothetical protein [Candidatus Poribacteria bacterium]